MTTEREIEIKLGAEIGSSEKTKKRKYLKRTCGKCGEVKWILIKAMWRAKAMSHQLCPDCSVHSYGTTMYQETTNR